MAYVTKLEFSLTPESERCERLCIKGHKRITWPSTFRVDMTWSDGKTNACDIVFKGGGAGASRVCMVAAQEQPYCFKFCEKCYKFNPNKIEADSYESLPSGFTARVFGYIDHVIVFSVSVSVLVVERIQTFGQSQPCIRYLVKMENAEESLFWVKRSYRNPPSVPENVFSKHRDALKDFVRPQARRICSHKIVYDRPRGHEIGLLFRLLIQNLPIDRVQANCSDGKVPKTASDLDAKKFMQLYSADFSQRLPEGASLSQLYDTLCEFVWRKTRTSKQGFQMPEDEYDRMKCALKWEGFYLHEDEVKEICSTTVMEYYAYAQQSSAV